MLADCERALGRPERALAYADDPDGRRRSTRRSGSSSSSSLAGARRDLGQADAAVLTLQEPARRTSAARPWAARLWYAYADALLHAGRAERGAQLVREGACGVDADGLTDAGDRLLALDGVVLEDLDDDDEPAATGCRTRSSPPTSPRRSRELRPTHARRGGGRSAPRGSVAATAAGASRPSAVASRCRRRGGAAEVAGDERHGRGPALLPVFASPPQRAGRRGRDARAALVHRPAPRPQAAARARRRRCPGRPSDQRPPEARRGRTGVTATATGDHERGRARTGRTVGAATGGGSTDAASRARAGRTQRHPDRPAAPRNEVVLVGRVSAPAGGARAAERRRAS